MLVFLIMLRRALSPVLVGLSLLATLSSTSLARAQNEPLPPPVPPADAEPPPPADPVAPLPPNEPPTPAAVAAPVKRPPTPAAVAAPAKRPPTDEAAPETWKPMMRQGAGIEVYWFSSKNFGSTFPMIPYAVLEVSKNILLDVHLPFSATSSAGLGPGSGKAGAGIGNPTVGLTYVTTEGRTSWHIGARISAPLAGASDEVGWQVSNLLAAVSMATYDIHYWARKYVPIGMRAGVDYQAKPGVFFRGSIDPTIYVPVGDEPVSFRDVPERTTRFYYQMRLEVEGRYDSGWGGGLGAQLVHAVITGDGTDAIGDKDNAQGALEPFVSYDSASTFARLGFLLAVDSPLGPGLDPDKVAALRLNLGSHF